MTLWWLTIAGAVPCTPVTRPQNEARNYDLKAVNPNRKSNEDTRTPDELLALIEAKGKDVAEALAALRK